MKRTALARLRSHDVATARAEAARIRAMLEIGEHYGGLGFLGAAAAELTEAQEQAIITSVQAAPPPPVVVASSPVVVAPPASLFSAPGNLSYEPTQEQEQAILAFHIGEVAAAEIFAADQLAIETAVPPPIDTSSPANPYAGLRASPEALTRIFSPDRFMTWGESGYEPGSIPSYVAVPMPPRPDAPSWERPTYNPLVAVFQDGHAEPMYESFLGPHGGAPYHLTRSELEALGGTWSNGVFTTSQWFPNTSSEYPTFGTPVSYQPASHRLPESEWLFELVPQVFFTVMKAFVMGAAAGADATIGPQVYADLPLAADEFIVGPQVFADMPLAQDASAAQIFDTEFSEPLPLIGEPPYTAGYFEPEVFAPIEPVADVPLDPVLDELIGPQVFADVPLAVEELIGPQVFADVPLAAEELIGPQVFADVPLDPILDEVIGPQVFADVPLAAEELIGPQVFADVPLAVEELIGPQVFADVPLAAEELIGPQVFADVPLAADEFIDPIEAARDASATQIFDTEFSEPAVDLFAEEVGGPFFEPDPFEIARDASATQVFNTEYSEPVMPLAQDDFSFDFSGDDYGGGDFFEPDLFLDETAGPFFEFEPQPDLFVEEVGGPFSIVDTSAPVDLFVDETAGPFFESEPQVDLFAEEVSGPFADELVGPQVFSDFPPELEVQSEYVGDLPPEDYAMPEGSPSSSVSIPPSVANRAIQELIRAQAQQNQVRAAAAAAAASRIPGATSIVPGSDESRGGLLARIVELENHLSSSLDPRERARLQRELSALRARLGLAPRGAAGKQASKLAPVVQGSTGDAGGVAGFVRDNALLLGVAAAGIAALYSFKGR